MRRTTHPDHLTLLGRQRYVCTMIIIGSMNCKWACASPNTSSGSWREQFVKMSGRCTACSLAQKFRISMHSVLVAKAKHEQGIYSHRWKQKGIVFEVAPPRWELDPSCKKYYWYADHIERNVSVSSFCTHTDLHAAVRYILQKILPFWCCTGGDVTRKE